MIIKKSVGVLPGLFFLLGFFGKIAGKKNSALLGVSRC